MNVIHKISRSNPPAARAAVSSPAALGPTAASAIWPYDHHTLAQVDAAEFAHAKYNATDDGPNGLATPGSDRSFHYVEVKHA